MPPARSRSQRKASGLANAAIALQSSGEAYSSPRSLALSSFQSTIDTGRGTANPLNRPLTLKERRILDEERQEKEERDRTTKRRKLQKRLDELERTNYRDAAGSSRPGAIDFSSRNDGEGFAIPNSALVVALGGDLEGRNAKQHKQSAAVRRLLTYRKSFHTLLEDASIDEVFVNAPFNYTKASATIDIARHRRPVTGEGEHVVVYERRPLFCTICGQSGGANCSRCGERLCGLGSCQETHNEARCDRPVR